MTNLDPVTKWTAAQLRRQADRFGLTAEVLRHMTDLSLERIQNELGGQAPVSRALATFVRLFGAAPKHVRKALTGVASVAGTEWRAIPKYPDYEVSALGDVRRHGRVLKLMEARSGHLAVTIYRVGGRRGNKVQVHRLVALAFHGQPADAGSVVRHMNGHPFDNRPENLRWGSHAENMADRVQHHREGKPVVEIPWNVRRLAKKTLIKQEHELL